MSQFYDALETRSPAEREAAHMAALPRQISHAQQSSPAFASILAGVDAASITSRAALAQLPVTRKYQLHERQQAEPPAAEAPPLARPPRGEQRPPPPHRHAHRPHLPLVPMFSALIVSLVSAFALAWYFAKPIRHLRRAFDAAAGGDLDVRIGAGMGGRRDELADLGRDFDHMTDRLGHLVDSQKRLLHDVSHEMR